MNPNQVSSGVEFAADVLKNAQDDQDYQFEQRRKAMFARAEEIHAKRVAEMSLEDLAQAFDLVSGYKTCLVRIQAGMWANAPHVGETIIEILKGSLYSSSLYQAMDEFKAEERDPDRQTH